MKIALDGFALSFAQGTGIARYALELSRALAERQHEVIPLFGLTGIGFENDLAWPRFVQSLILRGEARSREVLRWGLYGGLYLPHSLASLPVHAKQIVPNPKIDTSAIAERLPVFTKLYNAPAIYRVAQAYAYILKRPLKVALDEKIDIWHTTLPLPVRVTGAKSVVTAHDIVPIVLPHSTTINLRHYRRIVRESFRRADIIFAVSEYTKKDLLSHFDLRADKVFVTHQAAEVPEQILRLSRADVADVLQKSYGLNFGRYLLFYGTIEPKKNVPRIVEAICAAKTDMPLVIVGKSGWLDDDVTDQIDQVQNSPRSRHKIIRLDYLPFDQLMILLKGARALVFPSLSEGFGIPLLEAMIMGCPIITSKSTSQPEVCGEAALFVDPLNIGEIACAIDTLASDDSRCAELIERGKARSRLFSREKYIAKLEEGYRLALAT